MTATMNPQYPYVVTDTYTPDRLIAGFNVGNVTEGATLISGQNLARGALLGRITASGKLTLSLSASTDGSQTPFAVLAEDTNASSADTSCTVYKSGEFDANAMSFGTGHSGTNQATIDGCRAVQIYFKTFSPNS